MEKLVLAVAVAFLLGALVGSGGGLGTGVVDEPGSDESRNFDSPGLSLTKSVGACDDLDPESGWVHDVAVGESFAVTLDATVVHDWDRTVTANVSRLSSGTFRIDLRTVPNDGTADDGTPDGGPSNGGASDDGATDVQKEANPTSEPPHGCAATHLSLGTSLPTDYEEFTVSVNGRTLQTVEYDGTVADLHRLPNPVAATGSYRTSFSTVNVSKGNDSSRSATAENPSATARSTTSSTPARLLTSR